MRQHPVLDSFVRQHRVLGAQQQVNGGEMDERFPLVHQVQGFRNSPKIWRESNDPHRAERGGGVLVAF